MPQKLAAMLLSESAAATDAVERAILRQKLAGGALDTALLELDAIDEKRLAEVLSKTTGLPAAPEDAYASNDARARRVFPAKIAEKYGLAPFKLEGRELWLMSVYPVDEALLDEISFLLSLNLHLHVGIEWRVRRLLETLYQFPLAPRFAQLAARIESGASSEVRAFGPTPEPSVPVAAQPSDGAFNGGDAPVFEMLEPGGLEQAKAAPEQTNDELDHAIQEPQNARPAFISIVKELEQPAESKQTRGSESVGPSLEGSRAVDPALAPQPQDRTAPPRWSLAQARQHLQEAQTRDGVVLTAVRYGRDFFEYSAAFAVSRGTINGYDALGESDARERCRAMRLPMETQTIFRTVFETRSPFLGPLPIDPSNAALASQMGRLRPRTALLFPVLVRDKLVCILYCDNGLAPVSPQRLTDFLLFAGGLSGRFEDLIREFKKRNQLRDSSWHAIEPARAEVPPREQVEVDLTDYEVTPASQAFNKAVDRELVVIVDALVETSWGTPKREELVARLVARGADAGRLLAQRVPGPLDAGKLSHGETLPVEEHGPILAALVALGGQAVPGLLPLLTDVDPERRYYAVLALGRIGQGHALPVVAERIFDSHAKVALAARGVLATHRKKPELGPVFFKLRQALTAASPDEAAQAARTLGQVRDVEAIPALITLLDSKDTFAMESASEALFEITLQQLGPSSSRWAAWWRDHQRRPRADWLLAALTHKERDVRLAAAQELRSAAQAPVQYFADASADELERSANAWAAWWQKSGSQV